MEDTERLKQLMTSAFDQTTAELHDFAGVIATFRQSLVTQGFTKSEANAMVFQWLHHYWRDYYDGGKAGPDTGLTNPNG